MGGRVAGSGGEREAGLEVFSAEAREPAWGEHSCQSEEWAEMELAAERSCRAPSAGVMGKAS